MTELETDLELQAKKTERAIKIALLDRGWTQKKLAELIGENKAQVNRAIRGDVTPKSKAIRRKIIEILNIK